MTLESISKVSSQSTASLKSGAMNPERSGKTKSAAPEAPPKEDSIKISHESRQRQPRSNVQVEGIQANSKRPSASAHRPQTEGQSEVPPSLRGSLTAYTAHQDQQKGSTIRFSA